MKRNHEKTMTDLQRLLKAQNFESMAEVQNFMDSMVGGEIPSLPREDLSPKERAQDLVFEAYELSPKKAKAKIEMALQLDPDCIEAYEFLGMSEPTPGLAMVFFEKGIAIGKKLFGGEYLKEHKGMFWGFHETRPYMRCLQQYSECLYSVGKVKECVAIQEEMIELNPNDNQGVRDQLLLYLIQLGEEKKFAQYAGMYKDDSMAFSLFNRALFAFKTEGESPNANKKLAAALKANAFVASYILSNKPIGELPGFHGIGDEREAKYYAAFARDTWKDTKGAADWLKEHSKKHTTSALASAARSKRSH